MSVKPSERPHMYRNKVLTSCNHYSLLLLFQFNLNSVYYTNKEQAVQHNLISGCRLKLENVEDKQSCFSTV